MKKLTILLFLILILTCERDKEIKENIVVEGQIINLNKSKIYLAIVDEGKIIDSTNVIDGKFILKAYIDEPKEMSLILNEKNSSEKFNFISEPTNILFKSSKEKFAYNAQLQNSKLFTEYKKFENHINKFDNKDLEMLAEQIEFSVIGNQQKYDSINKERINLNQKKILFIVNYSINNNNNPLSAFVIYKHNENINKNYIEKVYKNFSDQVKKSYYGKKLVFKP